VDQVKTVHTFAPDNITSILHAEVGKVFAKVLEHAGVYKRTAEGAEAFLCFVDYVNQER
jgi:UDPglucose--hexose-1-phosphate uridylyltransferase